MSVKTGVFPSNIPGKSVFTKASSLSEMPYQQQRGKSQLAESLSSEHEILVKKHLKQKTIFVRRVRISITKLQRRQNSLKLTLIQLKKMPSTDDENNLSNSTDQFRLLDENAQTLKISFRIWKVSIERLIQTPSLSIGSFF